MKSPTINRHIILGAAILILVGPVANAMVVSKGAATSGTAPATPPQTTAPLAPNIHWRDNTNGFRGTNGFFYRAPVQSKQVNRGFFRSLFPW